MSEFDDFDVSPKLKAAVSKMRYKEPTDVQIQTIPLILEGHNVLSKSFTGSGKTLAFGIPLSERILQGKSGYVLVLCPTRELAVQVKEELIELNKFSPIKVLAVYGGHSIKIELRYFRQRFNILCATPGRLLDHFRQRSIDPNIFDTVVLDEADRILDMGFIEDLKKIFRLVNPKNTHLFSATLDGKVARLIHEYIPKYKEVIIKDELLGKNIFEQTIRVNKKTKFPRLIELIKKSKGRFLVFVSTKRYCDVLGKELRRAGFKNAVIHGDKTQKNRERSLDEFKTGKKRILIATDVAARGLQINDIEYVINYDPAKDADTHKHRIGRTGRVDKKGHAITFISSDDPNRGRHTGRRRPRKRSQKPPFFR